MKYLIFTLFFIYTITLQAKVVWEKYMDPETSYSFYNKYGVKELKDGSILYLFSYVDTTIDHEIPALIKSDTNGKTIWQFSKSYGHKVVPLYVTEEENGDLSYYCSWVRVTGTEDIWDFRPLIIKLDKDGNYLNTYCDSLITMPKTFEYQGSFVQDENNNIYQFVIGYKLLVHYLYVNVWDSLANFQKQIIIDSTLFNEITPGIQNYVTGGLRISDSSFLLRVTNNIGTKPQKHYFLKLDNNFNKLWQFTDMVYDTMSFTVIKMINLSNSKGFGVLARTYPKYSDSIALQSIFIKLYDNEGNVIAKKCHYNKNRYTLYDFFECKDKGFIIIGDTTANSTYVHSYLILKTDSLGNLLSRNTWEKYSGCWLSNACESSSGDFYVLGGVNDGAGTYYQYLARVELENATDIIENTTTIYNNITISPNPVSYILNINNSLIDVNSTIEIYNIYGQKVIECPFKNEIDVSKLSSGVYYLKINDKIEKFVKI